MTCVVLLSACTAAAPQSDIEVGIQEGLLAPEFELEELGGQTVKLSDYRGQVVLINFWATWCSYCRTEFPDLQRAYDNHRTKGFVVLAVNVQDRQESVQAYVEELGLTFPVLLDPLARVSGPYRARGLPTSYFVNQEGVIVLKKVGPVNKSIIEQVLVEAGVDVE
jgi:peroxiredoxin